MKHTFALLATTCLLTSNIQAQDTVRYRDRWYMFNEYTNLEGMWFWNEITGDDYPGEFPLFLLYQYNRTDNENTIYGIAVTMNVYPINSFPESRSLYELLPVFKLYNRINTGAGPALVLVDSVGAWNVIKQETFDYQTDGGNHLYFSEKTPCYEFYFNQSNDFSCLSDTFFVAMHWNLWNCLEYGYYMSDLFPLYVPPMDADEFECTHEIDFFFAYERPQQGLWLNNHLVISSDALLYADTLNVDFLMRSIASDYSVGWWGMMFPIVNLRCVAPRIRLVERGGDGSATVRWWAAEAGEEYQLAIGEYGGDPDSATLVLPATGDSTYTFTGLADGVRHAVWVRKACHYTTAGYDTLVWSDWSIPAAFYNLDIGEVGDGLDFTVSPNPAHGTAQATLPEAALGGRLTLCDLAGRELATQTVAGPTARLDIGTLPAGIYLVKLVTPAGVSTRRLVVE